MRIKYQITLLYATITITYDIVGTLVLVCCNTDSKKYSDILDENLWPEVAKCFQILSALPKMKIPYSTSLSTVTQ